MLRVMKFTFSITGVKHSFHIYSKQLPNNTKQRSDKVSKYYSSSSEYTIILNKIDKSSSYKFKIKSNYNTVVRKYCSALFITNDKLEKLCNNVIPNTDINFILDNQDKVRDNLKRRHLNSNSYNFKEIQEKYNKYLEVEKDISDIEFEIIKLDMLCVGEKKNKNEKQFMIIKNNIQDLKNKIKKYDDFVLDYQKNVIIKVLKLPNELDDRVPDHVEVVFEFNTNKESVTEGKDFLNQVDCINKLDINYKNKSAKFQYIFPILLKHFFVKKYNYIQFTNTDLCKSVIVEGCGIEYNCPHDNLLLINSEYNCNELGYDEFRYHLTGSSHLNIFCAYHTNNSVNYKDLPVRYITSGKQYKMNATNNHSNKSEDVNHTLVENLYESIQKEVVNIFIGTQNSEKIDIEFNNLQNQLIDVFIKLNVNFRVIKTPAFELNSYETYKLECQVYSNTLDKFITISDIYLINNYISRRLNICFHTSVTSYNKNYLFILGANVYVNKLLTYFIESNYDLNLDLLQKQINSIVKS